MTGREGKSQATEAVHRRIDPRLLPLFDGHSFALMPVLGALLLAFVAMTVWALLAFDPQAAWHERQLARLGLWCACGMDVLLLIVINLAWMSAPGWLPSRLGVNAVYAAAAAVAILLLLATSGRLGDVVEPLLGPPPPKVMSREEIFDGHRSNYERFFPGAAGAPRPASWFEGNWRRSGVLQPNDLRKLELRTDGDRMRVKIWFECKPGAAPCPANDIEAKLERESNGHIARIRAEVPIQDGRLWLLMANGRNQDDLPVIVTLAQYGDGRISSSGGPVALRREGPAVAAEEFVGEWGRGFAGAVGELTRLTVRQADDKRLLARAWMRCDDRRECELGEQALQAEATPDGVREMRASFRSGTRELAIAIEAPARDRLPVNMQAAEIRSYRVADDRFSGGGYQQVDRNNVRSARVELRRGPAPPLAALLAAEAGAAADPSTDCAGANDLHAAVARGCEQRTRDLLQRSGVVIDERDRLGRTPLALAVLLNRRKLAEQVLAAGADVNAPIRFAEGDRPGVDGAMLARKPELSSGSTPLILAADAAMVDLLLKAGARTDAKNGYGWSAIFVYTHHGSPEMLERLLAGGARVDDTADYDPSHKGTTPLMWAAYMNRLAQLRILLQHGARGDIRDAAHKTALDYARQFGHAEAVRLLSPSGT